MLRLYITIEDHVVPQLLTSALEAFEIYHRNGRKKEDRLETFGLLWGYVVTARDSRDPRIIGTVATVETSALRKNDSVEPNLDSLKMKMEFVSRYWPHLEVVGTFHSHPYESVKEVRSSRGWQASTPETAEGGGDTIFWPWLHKELFPHTPFLAHLIVTVTKMSRQGWAHPKSIEVDSGFELSMETRKLWITSYGTEINYPTEGLEEEDTETEYGYALTEKRPHLDIPSLIKRVTDGR